MIYYEINGGSLCYPFRVSQPIMEWGVLSEHIGKKFDRDEIDKIICEMIMHRPYIVGSMFVKIDIVKREVTEECDTTYRYHLFTFKNDEVLKQRPGDANILYEK